MYRVSERMAAGIETLHAFTACSGRTLVLGPAASGAGSDDVPLALATALGEREAAGEPVRVVVLRLSQRDDAAWAAAALSWLQDHGRRGLIRTPVVLSEELVEIACRFGSTVLLELAHAKAAMQAALVGPSSDSAATLLLHAQHLRGAGLEVAAVIAPIMPVIHERDADVVTLVRHIVAADLRDAHLSVGRLSFGRLRARERLLSRTQRSSLLRAFDLDPLADVAIAAGASAKRIAPIAAATLYHSVRRFAQSEGLRVDACGCPAQCHLDPELTPAYVPVLAGDLFADAG
jgi:hypothetical protein